MHQSERKTIHKWAGTYKKGPYGFPVCGSSNAHAQSPIGATDILFCLKLPQGLYCKSANSKGSGKTALKRRLAWAFVGGLCDKNPFLICWLIYSIQPKYLMMVVWCFTSLSTSFKSNWDNGKMIMKGSLYCESESTSHQSTSHQSTRHQSISFTSWILLPARFKPMIQRLDC